MILHARRHVHDSAQVDVWAGGTNLVRISGVIRELDVGSWLNPLIDTVHTTAIAARLTEVALDIRALEYANAALWRCLVYWVRRLREEREIRYRLRIISDPMRQWQQIGVPTLRAFSLDARGAERLVLEEVASS